LEGAKIRSIKIYKKCIIKIYKVFANVCKLLQVKKIHTTAYHPEGNGALERSHRMLKEYLRSFVNKKLNDWDELISYAMYTYNTSIHTSTNYTPFELIYGYPPRIPNSFSKPVEPQYDYDDYSFMMKRRTQECYEVARDTIIISKNNYDKTMNPLTKGSCKKILLKNNQMKNKLASKWEGPYGVVEWHDNENITIQ